MTSRQEEPPPQLQGGSSTLKQEDPQPPHIKEEEEECWTTQEGECLLGQEEDDLTKFPLTVVSVKTEEHEDKPPESSQLHHSPNVQQLIGRQEERGPQPPSGSAALKQEDPQPLRIKEEGEELWITQEGECLLGQEEADLTEFPLTVVSMKTEEHEDKPPESSESRGAEPPSSSSTQHMTTEADGDHCGGSQADKLLAPLSDSEDITSHSSQDEDGANIQEPLSSDTDWEGDMWTHTDNGQSKYSQKRTRKKHLACSVCPKKFPSKNVQQLIGRQEERGPQPPSGSAALKQEDPQPPHIKEEGEELWITQEGECLLGQEEADLTEFPLTVVSVKTEEHEDKPPESSESRGAEPPSSSSTQHMTTEADGDHCGGSQADKLLAPLSDSEDITSHSSQDEDGANIQEPLSSDTDWEGDMWTHTDNGQSKYSQKRTRKKHLACSVCPKKFPSKSELTRHVRTHTGEKPFNCSVCGKRFSQKGTIKLHMRTHTREDNMRTHTDDEPSECSQKKTGKKHLTCSVCAKSFSFKSDLTRHMRTHTGAKPYSCTVCGKRFSQKGTIALHMRTHTGERPFVCSVCGKRFSNSSNMVSHIRTHTCDKPFRCSVCDKSYCYKRDFARHMKIHTGEKTFSCSVCGDKFAHNFTLVRHMKKHTGEKPFSCSICGKRFSEKAHMRSHLRTHTGEKLFGKKHLTTHLLTANQE
ncbi:zinc finger protein 37 homolog isoform X2 [Entelurus aequoreus]|uniref:zinc finger protein 37 homolog isoform X2 n=1 Tax=Entelurus aequoreus TaxID=161455 RepID=UPI002B1D076B|nr:zinc finger protein 37 homolog isoform X2 [Entelurus aequoreus]